MKAVIQERYGSPDHLEVRDVDMPMVGADDVLVRVYAKGTKETMTREEENELRKMATELRNEEC